MDIFDKKTNNELFLLKKDMEIEHESIKLRMLRDYDKLVELEKQYELINNIINQRLKK